MNTFGLKRKGFEALGLRNIQDIIVEVWKDAIRFSVLIKRKLLNRVEF